MTTAPTQTNASNLREPSGSPTLTPWRKLILPIFILFLTLGSIGMIMRLVGGHLPAGYGSYVPWGLWIAIYFHGVGIAAGAFAISAVGYLFRAKGFHTLTSLRVACVIVVAAMVPGLLAVALDLGQPFRAYRLLFNPSFTSMMAFNTWMYLLLLAICAAVWFLSYRPDNGWLKPFLILGTLSSLMIPSQSGAFLGVVDAKPYWNSALLPIMMLVSALVAGAAVLIFVRALVGDGGWAGVSELKETALASLNVLRKVMLFGLFAYFLMVFAKFSIAIWNPQGKHPEIALLLFGPYWWVFWIVNLLIGGIIPIVLLLSSRPTLWIYSGIIITTAFISARLDVLIPGQAVGLLKGLQEAYSHPRLSYLYNPTLMEYLVAMFILAMGIAILYIGLRTTANFAIRSSRKDETNVID